MEISRRYTRAELRDAVAGSTNIRQVCLKLDLAPYGGNYRTLRRHIAREGLDVSHFGAGTRPQVAIQARLFDRHPLVGPRVGAAPFTIGDLEFAVAASNSMAGVARRLDVKIGTTAYRHLRKLITDNRLDTSHFLGQAWSRDMTGLRTAPITPLADLLVKGRPYASSALKERLISEGLKDRRCEQCLGETWQGRHMPLELDHINGDPDDNRLENLRILCPNCHALTDNYRGKNIRRR